VLTTSPPLGTGHTNSPFFDGEFLAKAQNVVVVTVNSRTNIFGFPGAPGITQNAGLRDQRLAVEWLQKNIGGFGGNSALITLFGQSAGAVAVDYWAYAYVKDPIVKGLISESGNALSFPLNTENATISNWYNVTKTLGCGASESSFDCMLTKNWTDIKAAAAKAPSASSGNPLRSVPAFYPTPDGETVFANYTALSEAGAYAKIVS
jgi:cholinesterase